MPELQDIATRLADVAAATDLNSQRTELAAAIGGLCQILEQHAQVLRNLQSRVDQLETRMAYVDPHRGC